MALNHFRVEKPGLAIVVLLSAIGPVQAAPLTWDGSVGNWDDDARWLPGGAEPNSFDDITINAGQITVDLPGERARYMYLGDAGTGLLNIQNGATLSSYTTVMSRLGGSSSTVNVSGAGTTWSNQFDLIVGNQGNSVLTITDGAAVTNTNGVGKIANFAGVIASATVSGAGSSWTLDDGLTIAQSGTGTLTIDNGGAVASEFAVISAVNGSVGTATVSGAGSTLSLTGSSFPTDHTLDVGSGNSGGNGTLNIADGGVVSGYLGTIGGTRLSLGAPLPGKGTVHVTDSGSAWHNGGTLKIANGTLTISNGGQVSNWQGYIGDYNVIGTVTVTDAGSTWTSGGALIVGYLGKGILNVENGGSASGFEVSIGSGTGVTGIANVIGNGSTLHSDLGLIVGRHGTGTLNIENGGTVNITTITQVASEPTGAGTIHFNNGTLNTGSLYYQPTHYTGTGTINANGLFADIDILFDAPNGQQQLQTTELSPSITLNLNLTEPTHSIMAIGHLGQGSFTLENGGVAVNSELYLGYESGAIGSATVRGAGTSWTNSFIYVGYFGAGNLLIEDGAALVGSGTLGEVSQAEGTATVTGMNTTWNTTTLRVGNAGTGTLTIDNAGKVLGRITEIGVLAGSVGDVIVTGPDSTLDARGAGSDLDIGVRGAGQLTIANGATVLGNSIDVAEMAGSTGQVTVTGAGSVWSATNTIYIGARGTGSALIEQGGLVSSTSFTVGAESGSSGTATVTDAGTRIETGSLSVGFNGVAQLIIENGAVVSSSTQAAIGVNSHCSGTIHVNDAGSILSTAGDLRIGVTGTGTLHVAGGQVTIGQDLMMELSIGSAFLNFTLTSLSDPLIDVDGAAILAGTLGVDLDAGFQLNVGDMFTLIDIGGTRTGIFDNFAEGDLLGSFDAVDLFLSYVGGDGNDVVAYAVAAPNNPADLDLDGDVDDADFGIAFAAFTGPGNGPSLNPAADLDNDGDVDDADFGVAFAQFTGPGGAVNVPEPASLAVLALGGLVAVRRRDRCLAQP